MKSPFPIPQRETLAPFKVLVIAVLFVLSIGLACNTPSTDNTNSTQIALNVQATQFAKEQTSEAEGEPEQVEEVDQQATLDAQSTQIAADVKSTTEAREEQTTSTPEPTNTSAPEDTEAPPTPTEESPTPEPDNSEDFETWMRSASILLYEDMAGDYSVARYISQALDAMSLNYVDVKDAIGTYKNQLLSGGPGGQGWDLIISGKERRSSVQGEFYVYLNDALNQGSSVIIEEWDIDDIAAGKISTILSRCGVEFHRDWINEPLSKHLLFPIDGASPIFHTPNEGISLTNPTGYWLFTDLGDLLRLRPGSDAKALWGARVNVSDSYLTAVTCLDGQLTIQTYSTHSYGQDRIILMWQNYIYNALKVRYEYLSSQ